MSNYTQGTFFTPKDSLVSGDPDKIIQGAEIDPEFNGIENAIATKVDGGSVGLNVSGTTVILDLTALTAAAIEVGDEFIFNDANDSFNEKKVTVADLGLYLETIMTIAGMSDYDANDNIDHSAVTVTGGAGVTGGGDLTASRVLSLDIDSLTNGVAIEGVDTLAFYDDDGLVNHKISFDNLQAAIDPAAIGGGGSDTTIDHSTVNIIAGVALAGGGDITADRTLDVDLTEPATITATADDDIMAVSDTSDAGATKGITIANAIGVQLGEARYSAASAQSLSASIPATVAFGTAGTDNLVRGTFASNTYTAGAAGARLLVSTNVTADTLVDGGSLTIRIKGSGSTIAEATDFNQADSNNKELTMTLSTVVVLAASATCVVEAETSSAEDLGSGSKTTISIVELG